MPVPAYQDLITPSSTANGLLDESVSERILSLLAMLAGGTAPDGTPIPLGGGGGGTGTVTSVSGGTGVTVTGTPTVNPTVSVSAAYQALIAGALQSLTAADTTVVIGGTATAPTVLAHTGTTSGSVAAGNDSRIVNAVQTLTGCYQYVTGPGLDPTGTTDSTAAIQAIINAVALAGQAYNSATILGGGLVILGPGVYKVGTTVPVIVPQGVRFSGCGDGNTEIINAGTSQSCIVSGNCDFNGTVNNTFANYSGFDVNPQIYSCSTATETGTNVWTFNISGGVGNNAGLNTGMLVQLTGLTGSFAPINQQCFYLTSTPGAPSGTTVTITLPPAYHGLGPITTPNIFAVPGAIGSSVEQMTINGSGATGGNSWCLQLYSAGHKFQYVNAINGRSGCISSESSGSAGTFKWATASGASLYDVRASNSTLGPGIKWVGPHDSKWFNVSALSNNQHGFYLTGRTGCPTALKMVSCYSFFNGAGGAFNNVYVDTNATAASMVDCQVGQAQGTGNGIYNIAVDASYFDMTSGEIIDTGTGHHGYLFGVTGGGSSITGCSIRNTLMGSSGSPMGAVANFNGDGGGNIIDVIAGNCTVPWITNAPAGSTRFLARGSMNAGASANIGTIPTFNLPSLASGAPGNGVSTFTPGTAYTNGSGADILLLVAVNSAVASGTITVTVDGQAYPVLTVTGGVAQTFGPFPVRSARNVTVALTSGATGGTWTWSAKGG